MIQLFGQVSVVFVYIMEAMKSKDGSFTPSLLFAVAMLFVSAIAITQLKDLPRAEASLQEISVPDLKPGSSV